MLSVWPDLLTASTMKSNTVKRLLTPLLALLFWLLVWEVTARIIGIEIILPSASGVITAFFKIVISAHFYKTVALSFLRIFIGFEIGVFSGIALSLLTNYLPFTNSVISPFMTVVRATPVASFIMVIWLMLGSAAAPTAITVLMVTPIIWQNLSNGFGAIDKDLDEVCRAFSLSASKRFRILVAPTLISYLIPGMITSAGLAWKAGIAAEIIAYTSNSIGREIFNAKNYLESADMLAWTAVVVIISLIFEQIISRLGRRFTQKNALT